MKIPKLLNIALALHTIANIILVIYMSFDLIIGSQFISMNPLIMITYLPLNFVGLVCLFIRIRERKTE